MNENILWNPLVDLGLIAFLSGFGGRKQKDQIKNLVGKGCLFPHSMANSNRNGNEVEKDEIGTTSPDLWDVNIE